LLRPAIVTVLMKFVKLARTLKPGQISEFEVNPFVIIQNSLLPLDVLVKCGSGNTQQQLDRPTYKLKNLLEPKSVAIIGVSEKLNPGHIILSNLIAEGFNKERLYVVKPGIEFLEGWLPRCEILA
jgi:hypothetical protein